MPLRHVKCTISSSFESPSEWPFFFLGGVLGDEDREL